MDAAFCTQCFQRNPVDAAPSAHATRAATSYSAVPDLGVSGSGVATAAMPGFPLPQTVPSTAASTSSSSPVRWRYKQIWMFGFAVWILPGIIGGFLGTGESMSTLIGRQMLFQILGYLLGGLVLGSLVRKFQRGDWSTFGFKAFDATELALGALLGLALLAAYAPIGIMLNQGRFGVDPLVRLLLGGASGPGLLLVGVVVVIGAPVIEEIYFRGLWFEKLRRTSVWLAIPVTAVFFTLAHGALLIPAILLMGVVLGFMRRKKSLWFTMGAHAAWNGAILVIAVVLMGGSFTYGSPSEPFSLTYPNTWHQSEEARDAVGPRPQIALSSPRMSVASFAYKKALQPNAELTLRSIVNGLNGAGFAEGMNQTEIMPTDVDFGTITEGYEVGFVAPGPDYEQPVFTTLVVVQKPSSKKALYAEFTCLRSACMDDVPEFEEILASLRLYRW